MCSAALNMVMSSWFLHQYNIITDIEVISVTPSMQA